MKMAMRFAWSGVGWVMPKVLMKTLASQRRGFMGLADSVSVMIVEGACFASGDRGQSPAVEALRFLRPVLAGSIYFEVELEVRVVSELLVGATFEAYTKG